MTEGDAGGTSGADDRRWPDAYDDEYWDRVGSLREREAFAAFLAGAGVTPIRSQSVARRLTAEQAWESVSRLNSLLNRLRASDSNAVSPGKGLAFVRRADIVSYVVSVRNSYLDVLDALQQQKMDSIEEAVESKVTDPEIREELGQLLTQIRSEMQQISTGLQTRDEIEANELRRLDIVARRWEVRKAMLEREPVAVLVGGVLLVGIAMALIVAMFVHTPIPEILASGFLLILGFFFGQNSTRSGS